MARLPIFGPLGVSPLALARLGLSDDRSLMPCARRLCADTMDICGIVSARGEMAPQVGQSQGSANRAIGTISSKSPQVAQVYL